MTTDTQSREENITEDEAALYDRQIRLWGLDAQKRLRAASILLIGLRGLGAEIAKNIVLAGVKSLTLLDNTEADDDDTASQFLIPHSEIGQNRAQASLERTQQLNPMVHVTVDTESIDDKDDSFIASFNVVCATGCGVSTLMRLDSICRSHGVKFYAGDVFGYYGFMFADLGTHHYAEDITKPRVVPKTDADEDGEEPVAKKIKAEELETITVKKVMEFPSLDAVLKIKFDSGNTEGKKKLRQVPNTYFMTRAFLNFIEQQKRHPSSSSFDNDQSVLAKIRQNTISETGVDEGKFPEDFSKFCFGQLSPVCAIVGGIIGQEIIKAVSQKDPPHKNFFFYNGTDDGGIVIAVGS